MDVVKQDVVLESEEDVEHKVKRRQMIGPHTLI